jgi:predicted nucleic acid-binding protein
MGILIDTSVFISLEKRDAGLASLRGADQPRFVSVVTASELLHGVSRARDEVTRARRRNRVETVLRSIPVVGIDLDIARAHAQIWAQQQAAGRMIGAHDLWLAATCIARGLSIATQNVREFERIPGLQVEHW